MSTDFPPYPSGLRLSGRRVVVIGGGQVAQRRVPALLAAGADVVVELRYEPATLRLEIRDNGPGTAAALDGLGIVGMRERAAMVGGTLETGPADGGGFAVRAALPTGEPAS